MAPGARKHWMQLTAVVSTMIAYFAMILMVDINAHFTPPCICRRVRALIATLIMMLLIFYMHYITLRKSFLILCVITFLELYNLVGIIESVKMIIHEGPQELDALDCIFRAMELYLLTIGLFFSILNLLYFMVD